MKDINTITVSGVVASTPEMKHVGQRNTAMLTFRLYSEREYAYQDKVNVDKNYFDVKVWGDHASATAADLREGNRVTVQGRLTQESWESQGQRKYKILIIGETVVNNDLRRDAQWEPYDKTHQAATVPQMPTYAVPTAKPPPPKFDDSPLDVKATILDDADIDDIPF